jgi:hypothetical protein
VSDLTIRELKEGDWGRWDEWLAQQPWGSPFSSAWWLDANCRAFGGHPLLLGVFDGEQLAGGVALRVRDAGPLKFVGFSILYCPVVMATRGQQRGRRALSILLDDMARRRLVIPSLACTPDMVDLRDAVLHHWGVTTRWTVLTALKAWSLDGSVSQGERKTLKRAARFGITARVEPPDADVLYNLVTATLARHGVRLPQNRRQLGVLIGAAGAHGMQVVVRDGDGVPLSAVFAMAQGTRTAYGVWGGTSAIGLAKGAAVAMYVLGLEELKAQGFEYFDWCGANLPGVSDFKLRFGGTLVTSLSIARQPLWFKVAFAAYHCAKRVRGLLRQGEHGQQG